MPLYGIHTEYIHVVDSHLAELSNLLLETRVCSMLKMNWNNESGAHSCSLARGGCSDSFINTTHTHTHMPGTVGRFVDPLIALVV